MGEKGEGTESYPVVGRIRVGVTGGEPATANRERRWRL